MVKDILLLGDKRLYKKSSELKRAELDDLGNLIDNLHDTLMNFREEYGVGRAIAAPQIGSFVRVIYMYIDEPTVFINPRMRFPNNEMMEVMDDCMSFPKLYVKVRRYRRSVICYKDRNWQSKEMALEGDLSELLQHEYDHLDGVLATMRAIDDKSFYFKGTF